MNTTKAYFATVHLLIRAEGYDEACDAVSALLSETGMYSDAPSLLDWAYQQGTDGGPKSPREVAVPEDFEPDGPLIWEIAEKESNIERAAPSEMPGGSPDAD